MHESTEGAPTREEAHAALSDEDKQLVPESPTVPLVLLKNTVIFPHTRMTINIGRERSVAAVKDAQTADRQFIAGTQRQAEVETPGPDDAFNVATLVAIRQYDPQSEGTIQIVVEGLQRVRITEWVAQEPYPRVAYELLEEAEVEPTQGEALVRHTHQLFERYTQLSRNLANEDTTTVTETHNPGTLADVLASLVVTNEYLQRQELLETMDPLARLEKLCVQLGNEIEILELENKIRQRVRQQVDKNQR